MRDKFRIIIVTSALLFIWLGFMAFLWLRADDIARSPCNICAEKSHQPVIFSEFGWDPELKEYVTIKITYHVNGSYNYERVNASYRFPLPG